MAKHTRYMPKHTRYFDDIVIERRQEIGRVSPSDSGEPMMVLAFRIIAAELMTLDDTKGDRLEFTVGQHIITVTVESLPKDGTESLSDAEVQAYADIMDDPRGE